MRRLSRFLGMVALAAMTVTSAEAAIVLTSMNVPVPPGCRPQLRWLQSEANALEQPEFLGPRLQGKPLTVYVMYPDDDPTAVAWTVPRMYPDRIFIRVDYLCVSSGNAITFVLLHEAQHLLDPDLSHEEIEKRLRDVRGMGSYEGQQREFQRSNAWMQWWREGLATYFSYGRGR